MKFPLRWLIVIWILIILLVVVRLFFFYTQQEKIVEGQQIQGSGQIQTQPKLKNNSQTFMLSLADHSYYVTTSLNQPLWYGEYIYLTGKVKIAGTAPHTFLTVSFPKIVISQNQSVLAVWTQKIRSHVAATYSEILPDDLSALLLGMVFGVQQQMSKAFLTSLQVTGVMHVIAASGMNITLIAGAVMGMTNRLFNRKLAILISLAAIFFYTALAGFQSSIVRAAIMGGFSFGANLIGRQRQSIYILILTATLMLLYNPLYLIDIGFQLSFLATAGILLIKPLFDQLVKKWHQKHFFILDDFSTSFAAQLGTTPILMTNFGYYNPLSVFINLFVLWTVAPLMLLGGLAAICGYIYPPLADLLLYLSYPFLYYFATIIQITAIFPSVWRLDMVPWTLQLGYYLVLTGGLLFISKKIIPPDHLQEAKNV